eukprot:jgi/Mesen1/10292/ME000079S09713
MADDDDDDGFFQEVYGQGYTGPLQREQAKNPPKPKPVERPKLDEEDDLEDRPRDPNEVPTDFTSREARSWDAKAKAIERNQKRRREEELICRICGETGHFSQGCPSTLGGGPRPVKPGEASEKIPLKDRRLKPRIIGSGGSIIQGIERDTNCKIRLDNAPGASDGSFSVNITGPNKVAVQNAADLVNEIVSKCEDEWRKKFGVASSAPKRAGPGQSQGSLFHGLQLGGGHVAPPHRPHYNAAPLASNGLEYGAPPPWGQGGGFGGGHPHAGHMATAPDPYNGHHQRHYWDASGNGGGYGLAEYQGGGAAPGHHGGPAPGQHGQHGEYGTGARVTREQTSAEEAEAARHKEASYPDEYSGRPAQQHPPPPPGPYIPQQVQQHQHQHQHHQQGGYTEAYAEYAPSPAECAPPPPPPPLPPPPAEYASAPAPAYAEAAAGPPADASYSSYYSHSEVGGGYSGLPNKGGAASTAGRQAAGEGAAASLYSPPLHSRSSEAPSNPPLPSPPEGVAEQYPHQGAYQGYTYEDSERQHQHQQQRQQQQAYPENPASSYVISGVPEASGGGYPSSGQPVSTFPPPPYSSSTSTGVAGYSHYGSSG